MADTQRERLIGIVKDSLFRNIDKSCGLAENIVDDIIHEGVIVPPCKVGDTVYVLNYRRDRIFKLTVSEIHIFDGYIGIMSDDDEDHIYYYANDIGKTVPFDRDAYYLSLDDAERAIQKNLFERKKNKNV